MEWSSSSSESGRRWFVSRRALPRRGACRSRAVGSGAMRRGIYEIRKIMFGVRFAKVVAKR